MAQQAGSSPFWQRPAASIGPGPDGRIRTGIETYERLSSAKRALSLIEAQLVTGGWTDPVGGKVRLRVYAERWIAHHASLRPRTRELYAWLLSAHVMPYLGAMPLGSITADTVREWRATLLSAGVSQTTTAKAYRLLRAILMTATEDRIIPRNPCRIRGGGDEKPPERPVLTIARPRGGPPLPGADPAGHLREPALGRGDRPAQM
jgi:hypothetical protein